MKRVGTLYHKPIVEGNPNEITDNQILLEKSSEKKNRFKSKR